MSIKGEDEGSKDRKVKKMQATSCYIVHIYMKYY